MPACSRSRSRSGSSLIGSADDDLRLVQHHGALGDALLADEAADEERQLVRPGELHRAGADEGAELGHLGDDHRHDLERVDLVVGVLARVAVLHDEHAQHLAEPLDRHAEEAREDLLAGLGQVAEAAGVRGVAGVDRLGGLGDPADQALADAQPRQVHRAPGSAPRWRRAPASPRGAGRPSRPRRPAPRRPAGRCGRAAPGRRRARPAWRAGASGGRGCRPPCEKGIGPRKSPPLNRPCPARRHHGAPAPPVPDICGRSAPRP